MFFSFNKYPDYKSFFKRRFFQLVIPYFIFNFITYAFWFFIGRKVGNDQLLNIDVLHPFTGIFYGHLNHHLLEHCAPLWFVACLFVVENIYYLAFKKVSSLIINILLLFLFVVMGYVDYKFVHLFLPWGINIAFSVMIFYGLGVLYRRFFFEKKVNALVLFVLFSFGITYLISTLNGKIEVSMKEFGNYLYYIFGALIGIIMVFSFSKIEEKRFGKINLQLLIGENTLIILAFHLMAGTFLKGIMFYVFKLDINLVQSNVPVALIYSALSIVVLIPVILFVNKYTPFIVGRKK